MPKSTVDGVDILLSILKGLALTFDGVIFTFLEILFNNFVVIFDLLKFTDFIYVKIINIIKYITILI